ncbi:MAG: ferredoxin, partial [Pseudomonadota bacterium]
MTQDVLSRALSTFGLQQLGDCQDGTDTITLIGPDEPRFWSIFCDSPEYKDGEADPLDRWSCRVLTAVAEEHNAEALFPFGGPP